MKTQYATGRRYEYRSKKILELAGYWVVRSAGSKGPTDLVAISSTGVILVQVKQGAKPGSLELETLEQLPRPANSRLLIHVWQKGASEPAVYEHQGELGWVRS